MWIVTVYFTTIIGLTFSSPKSSVVLSVLGNTSRGADFILEQKATYLYDVKKVPKEDNSNLTNENFTEIDPGGQKTNVSSNLTEELDLEEIQKLNVTYIIHNFTDNSENNSTKALNNNSNGHSFHRKYESTLHPHLQNDPKFSTKYKKMVELMHIESIKVRLLAKLRLDKPPKLKGLRPALPFHALGKEFIGDEGRGRRRRPRQDFYAKSVQLFVMGTDGKV